MDKLKYIFLIFLLLSIHCSQPQQHDQKLVSEHNSTASYFTEKNTNRESSDEVRGALLLQRFNSFEELKSVIDIKYSNNSSGLFWLKKGRPQVNIFHSSGGKQVMSTLNSGINEFDIYGARDGGFMKRMNLVFNSPYAVLNRNDMRRIFLLGRRRDNLFGEGDVAFYDVAETMMHNISDYDKETMDSVDLSEKGYLNTFIHLSAQAFMTSVFSEKLADFISDLHERHYLPELVTGNFSKEQIADIKNGPTDNYIDIINNEWGQELGKVLRERYKIDRNTNWTPHLLATYLNDIQSYCSWAFQIGFNPFMPSDELVVRFSTKINKVMSDLPMLM